MAGPFEKRLLFFSTAGKAGPGGAFGGGERIAADLLTELARRGWQTTLACPGDSPLMRPEVLGAQLEKVPIDLSAKISNPAKFFFVLLQWLILARRTPAQVFYGNAFESLKWIAAARWVRKVATVCHLHESYYDYYGTARCRKFAASVDRFFAISETVREEFSRRSGVAADSISVIHNGISMSSHVEKNGSAIREELSIPAGAPFIFMAARTDGLKGHAVLLRALPAVRAAHPTARVIIAGISRGSAQEIAWVDEWERLIQEMDLDTMVTFLPFRPDVRRLMRSADLVVVPSTSEGFGLTAIEAMAEQTAVIAAEVGGLAEIIQSGHDGLLFPGGDSAALAGAIKRLLANPAERERLAAEGRCTVETRYSTGRMVDEIEKELLQLLPRP